MTMLSRTYHAIYPALVVLSTCSIALTLIGLSLWTYQALGGQQINWEWFVLWGFAGCWIFPGLAIALGVWVTNLEGDRDRKVGG